MALVAAICYRKMTQGRFSNRTAEYPCYASVLHNAHRVATPLGVTTQELLKYTGLDRSILEEASTVISKQQALYFYQNLVEAGPPDVGIDVGLATKLNEWGPYGYLLASVDTVRRAIELGKKYYDLAYLHVGWQTRREGDTFYHRFVEENRLGSARQFCMDRALVALHMCTEHLSSGKVKPKMVSLDRKPPPFSSRYEDIFDSPVRFSQEFVEIAYDVRALEHTVSSHDQDVFAVMNQLCQNLLERLYGHEDIVATIRELAPKFHE